MKLPSRTVPDQASQLNFEKLERTIDPAPVTSLPTTDLYVGRRIVYAADAANGVYWDLVYIGGASPWAASGPPLRAEVQTSQSKGTAAYGALATVGPAVTVPLAGTYDLAFGCNIECASASGWRGRCSFDGTDAGSLFAAGGGSAAIAEGGSFMRFVTGLTRTAGQTTTLTYEVEGTGTVFFEDRWLTLTPVLVG